MNAVWKAARSERLNPYLDWEVRNRRLRQRGESEEWCSVQIQLLPTAGDYVSNLRRLAAAVFAGRQDDDAGGLDDLTIRMAGDEQQQLEKLLAEIDRGAIQPPTDPVAVQFFIYRPESVAYRHLNSRSGGFYDIIDIGPPIAGLRLSSGAPDPTAFDHSLAAFSGHVAIGIVDDGIAFAHQRFRDSRGKSRIKAIWLQDIERPTPDRGVAFGRRLDNDEINTLLRNCRSEAEIYRQVGLLDFGSDGRKSLASRRSHGTHILDLAGGFDPAGRDDVKERRPLLAVQLPSMVTGDTSGFTLGSYVLQAVRQIMLWADMISPRLPLVINFSYGIFAGPKNGTHQMERTLSRMIESRNRRGAPTCLVLPAGNSYDTRVTARMELETDVANSIDWIMLPDDGTPNHLEIWLDGVVNEQQLRSIELELTPPVGAPATVRGLGDGDVRMLEVDDQPIAGVYYNIVQSPGAPVRGRIHVAVNATTLRLPDSHPAPAGRWRLTLANASQNRVTAHLYIQRNDTAMGYPQRGRQSHFDHAEAYDRIPLDGSYRRLKSEAGCPITSEDTLSAIATGIGSIVVGAANALGPLVPADYTSSGPAMSRVGPDCSAITDHGYAHSGVLAAGTCSGSVVTMRGTSVAAPQLVRQIADYLGQGSGPVFFTTATAAAASVPAQPSGAAALDSIASDSSLAVPSSDLRRLGPFVLRERETEHIPRRKY